MTIEEAKSCIGTIEMLQRLAYNIHGVMDVVDADNCKNIIKALEQEPCEDCISRQAVLDINENHHGQMPNHVNHEIWNEIKALPSVTPKEKTGRWIPLGNYDEWGNENSYKCSNCGERNFYADNYCHNCGAKMEEVENDT